VLEALLRLTIKQDDIRRPAPEPRVVQTPQ